MSLTAGSKLGAFEIIGAIGAGGMGEVYRARDAKLGRDVAVKILPDSVALDADRIARFEREARTLATLNHPHIAQVYGFEQANGVSALVMELVEGEDLGERLARGAIAMDEALPIASQIAEALEAAHDAGIIHRDLKPANIKLRADGTVKVLDFGLAKVADPAGPGSRAASDTPVMPTITSPAMTAAGVILGTAAYMSPEQAKGRNVDRRADIWAFGCVVYEILTGTRAFPGDDISETIVAILRDPPDWSLLPASTPMRVRQLLHRCLEKDARKRLPHIGVARLDLSDSDGGDVAVVPAPLAPRSRARALAAPLAWSALGAVLAVAIGTAVRSTPGANNSVGPVWIDIEPVAGAVLTGALGVPRFAISPDGRTVVYQSSLPDGTARLFLRDIGSGETTQVQGVHSNVGGLASQQPFWSPDAQHIAFFDEPARQLKKWTRQSGTVQVICDLPGNQMSGSWMGDNTILFSTLATGGIRRVSSSGGEPSQVTTVDPSKREAQHLWPDRLPDGRHFLYFVTYQDATPPAVFVGSLDGAPPRRLLGSNYMARFAAPNRLLFVRDEALVWQTFDPDRQELSGEPVLVANSILKTPAGRVAVSASENGVLMFSASERAGEDPLRTFWVDRNGREVAAAPPSVTANAQGIRLSPDGRLLAFGRIAGTRTGIPRSTLWLQDTARGIETRVEGEQAGFTLVAFSADSSLMAIRRVVDDRTLTMEVRSTSGAGTPREFLRSAADVRAYPIAFTPDGLSLLFAAVHDGRWGYWTRLLSGNAPPSQYLSVTDPRDVGADLSPDGKWLAFAQGSEEDSRQVVMQSFPDPSNGRQIVAGLGSSSPRWRRDGRELFFVDSNRWLASVAITTEPRVEIGRPTRLFELPVTRLGTYPFDVTPDGERFVVLRLNGADRSPPLTVIVNWTDGIE